MVKSVDVARYALKTLAAKKEVSCESVYEGAIMKLAEAVDNGEQAYYIGVKNTDVISYDFRKTLESKNLFVHTLDKMAYSGRAVDLDLINPITGRFMSGSSSGTAINVFKGINDIGVGTDGGGSVLAPALSLNLYAMISPLFDQHTVRKYSKKSTDGIVFSPSIGFISKTKETLKVVLDAFLPTKEIQTYAISYATSPVKEHQDLNIRFEEMGIQSNHVTLSYEGLNRRRMMEELQAFDFDHQILISCEGPIDLLDYGDSVMGGYDALTQQKQADGHKYYLKIVNMLGLSAFVVPTTMHARGYLVVCKSDPRALQCAFKVVQSLDFTRNELETRYFNCEKRIMEDVL